MGFVVDNLRHKSHTGAVLHHLVTLVVTVCQMDNQSVLQCGSISLYYCSFLYYCCDMIATATYEHFAIT